MHTSLRYFMAFIFSALFGTKSVIAENSLYEFTATSIDGAPAPLSTYAGNVSLVVNTASKCGFTGQFEGLEALYEKYKGQGFVVLGFPSNDFLGQDPGSDSQIKAFCTQKYGVTFPMFAKAPVSGSKKQPIFQFLTESNPALSGRVTWNFNKFLVNRSGKLVARFGSKTEPGDADLISQLEALLAQ